MFNEHISLMIKYAGPRIGMCVVNGGGHSTSRAVLKPRLRRGTLLKVLSSEIKLGPWTGSNEIFLSLIRC